MKSLGHLYSLASNTRWKENEPTLTRLRIKQRPSDITIKMKLLFLVSFFWMTVCQEFHRIPSGMTSPFITEFVMKSGINMPGCFYHTMSDDLLTLKCLQDARKLVTVEVRILPDRNSNRFYKYVSNWVSI